MSSTLRIGTSGWNYPRGRGTWNGVFYPPARGRAKGFDELSFYAEHFNTVEVNTTFYGQPRAEVSRDWGRRTPPGFEFSVKLYQKFTHPHMYAERLRPLLPGGDDDAARRDAIAALGRPAAADIDEFKLGIDPLLTAGKLGPLLAQFPASFKNGESEREYLMALLEEFKGYRVAVELRHSSWSDSIAETLGMLNAFGAAWAQIDEPKFRFSIRQNLLPNVTGFYYMRLHGRNAANWWKHDAPEDRYDYLYSQEELQPFVGALDAAGQLVKKAYLYTNNHFSAQGIANAVMIKRQLGQPIEGEYPPEFVARYGEVMEVARVGLTGATSPRRTPAR
jgi:uncharacterized protein YecE (DUF72 family)